MLPDLFADQEIHCIKILQAQASAVRMEFRLLPDGTRY